MDANIDNKDGKISGTQMWMTGVFKDAFPDFFSTLDNNSFKLCTFYRDGQQILKDKSFEFVYSYFSAEIDQVKVYGKNGKEIKKVTVRKIIEDYWNSDGFRKIIEEKLSAVESRLATIHHNVINALIVNNESELSLLHDDLSQLCSIQQSRIPENVVTKHSIDIIQKTLNEEICKLGRPDLQLEYEKYDYKDICQVQLLKLFIDFEHSNLLTDKSLLKYDSIYDAYLNRYKESSFFFMKSTKSHKFVIGDDPIISIKTSKGPLMLAFPISPDFCLLVLRSSGSTPANVIIPGNNNAIDYINFIMCETTTSGVVSKDKKFLYKKRTLDEEKLVACFRKKLFKS